MASPASFKGHPIHPMLVVFPLGLWTFSLVCDVVYLFGWGGAAWASAALYAIGGGVVGALLAAIPGLIDLLSLKEPRTRRIGILHMVVNLAAVAVFAFDFWLRLDAGTGAGLPVLLSILGVALISLSGWLGGELVYVHGVAVQRPQP